ncbi:unnamed protein product [Schistocephalus solidus]|uniref:Uncharacterized protein n=1 Tax=Schistocephalus solidus TaxID=70667 RepID=A0A183T6K2_SCHSO|nr:unnamed protein product [Schistocephalus solidus]
MKVSNDSENWTAPTPGLVGHPWDVDFSTAELVFGATLRLPSEMISSSPRGVDADPNNLLHRLLKFMRTLSPVPPRPSMPESYIEKHLATCSHV